MISNTMTRLIRPLGLALLLLHGMPSAQAQFAGDVYFTNPHVEVPEGTTAVLELEVFTGAQAFGAALLDLHYFAHELEIVSVEGIAGGEVELLRTGNLAAGLDSVLVLNRKSITSPVGSTRLVQVQVRPLLPVGAVAQITVEPRSVLQTDRAPMFPSSAYSALVQVTAPFSLVGPSDGWERATGELTYMEGAWDPMVGPFRGHAPLRPAGGELLLPGSCWSASAGPGLVRVQTRDPQARRDELSLMLDTRRRMAQGGAVYAGGE